MVESCEGTGDPIKFQTKPAEENANSSSSSWSSSSYSSSSSSETTSTFSTKCTVGGGSVCSKPLYASCDGPTIRTSGKTFCMQGRDSIQVVGSVICGVDQSQIVDCTTGVAPTNGGLFTSGSTSFTNMSTTSTASAGPSTVLLLELWLAPCS